MKSAVQRLSRRCQFGQTEAGAWGLGRFRRSAAMTDRNLFDYESFTNRCLPADMNWVRGCPCGSEGAWFANTSKGPTHDDRGPADKRTRVLDARALALARLRRNP